MTTLEVHDLLKKNRRNYQVLQQAHPTKQKSRSAVVVPTASKGMEQNQTSRPFILRQNCDEWMNKGLCNFCKEKWSKGYKCKHIQAYLVDEAEKGKGFGGGIQ